MDALDAMAGRSVPAEQQAAYKAARKQWMALKIAEDAVDESGNVTSGKLNRSIQRHMPKPGTGKDIYRALSRSMKIVGEAVPNSGTPLRALAMGGMIGSEAGLAGIHGLGLEAALGAAVPLSIQAMMLNPRTARYITRQLGEQGAAGAQKSELMRRGAGAGAYGTIESLYR